MLYLYTKCILKVVLKVPKVFIITKWPTTGLLMLSAAKSGADFIKLRVLLVGVVQVIYTEKMRDRQRGKGRHI